MESQYSTQIIATGVRLETNLNSQENITLIISTIKVLNTVETIYKSRIEMKKCNRNSSAKIKETRYRKVHNVVTLPCLMVFTLRHNIKGSVATLRAMPGLEAIAVSTQEVLRCQ